MSGPHTSSLLLLIWVVLFQSPALEAKPLSALHGAEVARLRRDLRDSLPYEAQMMSYPPAGYKGRGNELYYQPEALREPGLNHALQRLVENSQRQDQEAAYLAGLMHLLNEAENNGQGRPEAEEDQEEDFQGPYPPDYDETEQTMSMAKPQAMLDPQLTEALLNRYRQERTISNGIDGGQDRDQQLLRYLVEKLLSNLVYENQQNQGNHPGKWEVAAAAGIGRDRATPLRRSRRSLDSVPGANPDVEASLLRVKRVGDEDHDDLTIQGNKSPYIGLQRMKRIDTDLPPPPKPSRKRRSVTYDPELLAQQIIQFLRK